MTSQKKVELSLKLLLVKIHDTSATLTVSVRLDEQRQSLGTAYEHFKTSRAENLITPNHNDSIDFDPEKYLTSKTRIQFSSVFLFYKGECEYLESNATKSKHN